MPVGLYDVKQQRSKIIYVGQPHKKLYVCLCVGESGLFKTNKQTKLEYATKC